MPEQLRELELNKNYFRTPFLTKEEKRLVRDVFIVVMGIGL